MLKTLHLSCCGVFSSRIFNISRTSFLHEWVNCFFLFLLNAYHINWQITPPKTNWTILYYHSLSLSLHGWIFRRLELWTVWSVPFRESFYKLRCISSLMVRSFCLFFPLQNFIPFVQLCFLEFFVGNLYLSVVSSHLNAPRFRDSFEPNMVLFKLLINPSLIVGTN